MNERERINEKTKEVMEKVVKQINKERQQIIFEHYVKVIGESEFMFELYRILKLSTATWLEEETIDQLKAFIEKVERGE